jgi:putative photosynthetic complex assembly protein 2
MQQLDGFSLIRPVLYALFLWWFTTGLIMALYGREPQTVRRGFVGATLLLAGALAGVVLTRSQATPLAVYLAVTCGTVIWGWQMASYYLGMVTGPQPAVRKAAKRPERRQDLAHRFGLALRASLHHELLVVVFALLLVGLTWWTANRWSLWIFLTLWAMHLSAKLNVFLGVRNFRVDFLPAHLHFFERLLTKRPINALFPVSVIGATVVALFAIRQAFVPTTEPGDTAGLVMVGTLLLLGVLEHWLLVLPLPAILWGWGVRPLPHSETIEHDNHGLGASLRALPEAVLAKRAQSANES